MQDKKVAVSATSNPDAHGTLSAQDVRRMLGENAAAKMAEILVLQPTLTELEEAIMWSKGDGYLLGRRVLVAV